MAVTLYTHLRDADADVDRRLPVTVLSCLVAVIINDMCRVAAEDHPSPARMKEAA